MDSTAIVWRPSPEVIEQSRIGHLLRKLQVPSIEALHKRSVEEPEWYWDAVVRDLGLRWKRPYTRVLDESRGVAWPRWFQGGLLNFADNCVDRHVDAGRGAHPAVVWEGDDGQTRTLTYAELLREVSRLANALRKLGIGIRGGLGTHEHKVNEPFRADPTRGRVGSARGGAPARTVGPRRRHSLTRRGVAALRR